MERKEWSQGVDLALKQGDEISAKYDEILKELDETLGLVESFGLVDEELEQ